MDEKNKKEIQKWMKEYQIAQVDLNLIIEALTHSSYKGMGYQVRDNERLEFLGDAVLDLVTAHALFLDSQLSEGLMTEKRKLYVNNEKLSEIFNKVGLTSLIRTANDFLLSEKNKADFIEAIFGAVFIDKGYRRCRELWDLFQGSNFTSSPTKKTKDLTRSVIPEYFIEFDEEENSTNKPHIFESISNRILTRINRFEYQGDPNKNAKNVLQEYCQKNFFPIPEYTLLGQSGPDHRPMFIVEVSIVRSSNGDNDNLKAQGRGFSKKEAEFTAAEQLCNELELIYQPR